MKIFTEIKRYFLSISSKISKDGPKDDLGVGSQKLLKTPPSPHNLIPRMSR